MIHPTFSWVWAGPLLVGFVFGFVGGRAISSGTNGTLLGALVTLIGAATLFNEDIEIAGMFMGTISIGYFFGIFFGSAMRQDTIAQTPTPGASPETKTGIQK